MPAHLYGLDGLHEAQQPVPMDEETTVAEVHQPVHYSDVAAAGHELRGGDEGREMTGVQIKRKQASGYQAQEQPADQAMSNHMPRQKAGHGMAGGGHGQRSHAVSEARYYMFRKLKVSRECGIIDCILRHLKAMLGSRSSCSVNMHLGVCAQAPQHIMRR